MAPSYLRATEPLSCIIASKNTPKYLIKPEALCSNSLHKPLVSRDQGEGGGKKMPNFSPKNSDLTWEKRNRTPGATYLACVETGDGGILTILLTIRLPTAHCATPAPSARSRNAAHILRHRTPSLSNTPIVSPFHPGISFTDWSSN